MYPYGIFSLDRDKYETVFLRLVEAGAKKPDRAGSVSCNNLSPYGAFFQVRVWELQRGYGNQGITAVPKAQINHDAPVLCTDFSSDGTIVFSGGASKQASTLSSRGGCCG